VIVAAPLPSAFARYPERPGDLVQIRVATAPSTATVANGQTVLCQNGQILFDCSLMKLDARRQSGAGLLIGQVEAAPDQERHLAEPFRPPDVSTGSRLGVCVRERNTRHTPPVGEIRVFGSRQPISL